MRRSTTSLGNGVQDGAGHVSQAKSAVLLYLPKLKGSVHRSHNAITGQEHLRPSPQITPCLHKLALRMSYYICLQNRL